MPLRHIRRLMNRRSPINLVEVEAHVRLAGCDFLGPVRVGYRSYANSSLFRNVEVGRFCSIGRFCTLGAASHPLDRISTHPRCMHPGEGDILTRIGNDVWIGNGAVILSGLTIGDGAVIGANAVVTHDVGAYEIVLGTPARLHRKRFADDAIEKLLKSQWWRYGDAATGVDEIDTALSRLDGSDILAPHFQPYQR